MTNKRDRQQELWLLQEAIDDVGVPITLTDPSRKDNPLVYVNNAYESLTGYSGEQALGRNWLHLRGEDTDPDAVSALREAVDNETQATVELCSYRNDGTKFWNRVTVTPVHDESGDLLRYLSTQEDITERKEREQRLAETTRQLQAVLDTVDAAVVIKDTRGRYQYANKKARQNLDVGADEDITGLTDHDLLPADVADRYRADDQRVIEAGETLEIEEEVPTPEGTQINRTLKSPFYDVDGELIGICAVSTDITEHERRRRRLTRMRTLMSRMERLADVGAWEYDPETGERKSTVGIKLIYEVGPETELTLAEAFEFFHPADRDRLRDRFERCLETGEPYESDARVVTANGEQKWVTVKGERVDSQDGGSVVQGYIQDITAQKERLARLEQIETLFENAQDMLFVIEHTDGEFVVRRVNEAFERATGLSNEQLRGKTPQAVFGSERGRETEQRYRQCLDAGEPIGYEEVTEVKNLPEGTRPSDSEHAYWETKIAPVVAGDNSEWIVGATRDINERKRRQRELEQQNERLDEFASVVSHDLRNPLQIAGGRLELAQADCDSDHIDRAIDALGRMDALIQDLLTLARSGETVRSIEPVSVSALAEQCWEVIPGEGATLTIEADRTVSADRGRLRQLLENLLTNAVEHSSGEDVTVRVGGLADGFYVADDGVGIPEGEREEVFEPGYSTAANGTGFGLRIVEQITDAHGWDIRVTDSNGDGARFEITGVDMVE